MNLQEKTIKESKFNKFISSYIADVLVFATGNLSVSLTFVLIYMLCRQFKLKSLVANMALHHVKTIEAATLKENENCDFGIMKFLIILNLAMTVLLVLIKIKKSRVFQGCLFTNMVKVNLFIAGHSILCTIRNKQNSQECASIQIDRCSTHREFYSKEKLDVGCIRNKLEQCLCNFKWQGS